MYEVIIAGGASDGHIMGEFMDYNDAYDMAIAINLSDQRKDDEIAIVLRMEV